MIIFKPLQKQVATTNQSAVIEEVCIRNSIKKNRLTTFSVIKPTIRKTLIVFLTCFTFQTTALANNDYSRNNEKSSCDVLSINGTGKLLADGRIVGKEILSIVGKEKQIEVEFTATTLGVLEINQASGAVTLATSHDFTEVNEHNVNFTTFDEITIVPLGGSDVSCTQNACGLIFKLKLEKGHGQYNCGEIVSGFNPDPTAPIPFTSYVNPLAPAANGDFVFLNSIGKLCNCNGNN